MLRTGVILSAASLVLAAPAYAVNSAPAGSSAIATDRLTAFVPRPDGRDNRLDYSVWTEALAAFVVSMGPPLRKMPLPEVSDYETRIQIGHNSIYRLEGAMIGFSLIDGEVNANIARYRRELEAVADTVDIQSLPRNEQLAYWLNLHNVALVEQIAAVWPVRQPREIMVGGVQLDEARFITVKGVALSLRDIRERIVYPNWKSPEVIYGFWRGEIGGPALQRQAFDGQDVGSQLASVALEFANSRRGVEKRGSTLHVSRFYAEVAPFFFPDFEQDLRAHLAKYAEGDVARMVTETRVVNASLYEHDIADMEGGRRANSFFANGKLDAGLLKLLTARARKFDYIRRTQPRTGSVVFSNIDLPGDPPNKGEVE